MTERAHLPARRDPASLASAVEPTRLDRLIAYVSPRHALKRLETRARLALGETLMKGFSAEAYTGASRSRKSLKSWNPWSGSANADLLPEHEDLRARSRDLIRNSPLGAGAVNTTVTNVVGTGLRLQPQIDREALGLSDEEADRWERRALRLYRAWSESEECDYTRIQNMAGLQDLVFRSTLGSGDVLTIRRFDRREGDVLGLKVQLVEGDRVSNPNYTLDLERLAGGVEIDETGSPVAYHVLNHHPGDRYLFFARGAEEWARIPVRGESSQERIAILHFERRRPGQLRGEPYLSPVIEKLKQLDRYADAELLATVISSMFTVFIKAETAGFGLQSADTGVTPEADEVHLGSGSIVELGEGESIEVADPSRPNQAFDPFVFAILRQIGTALELPLELLIKEFRNSYSASRAALLEAWKFFRKRREWIAGTFCQPIYGWVIAEAVARGILDAPGFFEDPILRKAWLGAAWTGPTPGQLDPQREVNASRDRIRIGVSSLAVETQAMTGLDWEVVHAQRAKERRARVAAGLESIETDPSTGQKAAAPPAEEAEPAPEEAAV